MVSRWTDIGLYIQLVIIFKILSYAGAMKYLLFGAWISLYAISAKYMFLPIKKNLLYILLIPFSCTVIGVCMSIVKGISFDTIKEICFILLPPIGAVILYNRIPRRYLERFITIMFWAIVTVFLIQEIPDLTLNDLMESQHAFIFGIYVIYFIHKKEKILGSIATMMLFFAHKRIALGATLIGLSLLFILSKMLGHLDHKGRGCLVKATGIASITGSLLFVYICHSGLIADVFRISGMNPQGRLQIWQRLQPYYAFSLLQMGNGLGSIAVILKDWKIGAFARLHNDILVYYFELGAMGFILYFYSYFYVVFLYLKKGIIDHRRAVVVCTFIIYTFICYCTDNISIYINYLFPFYTIILACVTRDETCHIRRGLKVRC